MEETKDVAPPPAAGVVALGTEPPTPSSNLWAELDDATELLRTTDNDEAAATTPERTTTAPTEKQKLRRRRSHKAAADQQHVPDGGVTTPHISSEEGGPPPSKKNVPPLGEKNDATEGDDSDSDDDVESLTDEEKADILRRGRGCCAVLVTWLGYGIAIYRWVTKPADPLSLEGWKTYDLTIPAHLVFLRPLPEAITADSTVEWLLGPEIVRNASDSEVDVEVWLDDRMLLGGPDGRLRVPVARAPDDPVGHYEPVRMAFDLGAWPALGIDVHNVTVTLRSAEDPERFGFLKNTSLFISAPPAGTFDHVPRKELLESFEGLPLPSVPPYPYVHDPNDPIYFDYPGDLIADLGIHDAPDTACGGGSPETFDELDGLYPDDVVDPTELDRINDKIIKDLGLTVEKRQKES